VSPTLGYFVSNTRWLFSNFTTANFRQTWPAMTRESRLKGRFWTVIYENFPFTGHLPPRPQTWKGSNRHPSQSTIGQEMHCREIPFTPRCSPRAREFRRAGQLFCTTYGCRATGRQNCQIFWFWPIFPIQNA